MGQKLSNSHKATKHQIKKYDSMTVISNANSTEKCMMFQAPKGKFNAKGRQTPQCTNLKMVELIA